jgi:uncharacterized protein
MKFIADAMLGKLAKRMRLLGNDVIYDPTLNDNEIIQLSLEQDRVILTRDKALAARPLAIKHLLIKSERVEQQLEKIQSSFHLKTVSFTRCSKCNEPIVSVAKNEVCDLLPQHVCENNTVFSQCPKCSRIYWAGTHVKNMEHQKIK